MKLIKNEIKYGIGLILQSRWLQRPFLIYQKQEKIHIVVSATKYGWGTLLEWSADDLGEGIDCEMHCKVIIKKWKNTCSPSSVLDLILQHDNLLSSSWTILKDESKNVFTCKAMSIW